MRYTKVFSTAVLLLATACVDELPVAVENQPIERGRRFLGAGANRGR